MVCNIKTLGDHTGILCLYCVKLLAIDNIVLPNFLANKIFTRVEFFILRRAYQF